MEKQLVDHNTSDILEFSNENVILPVEENRKMLVSCNTSNPDSTLVDKYGEDKTIEGLLITNTKNESPLIFEYEKPKKIKSTSYNKLHAYLGTFEITEKWEGNVVQISDEFFSADLVSLTKEMPLEQIDLPHDQVQPEDRELLKLGASFYLTVGHAFKKSGERGVQMVLRFKRLPDIPKNYTKKLSQIAKRLRNR